MNRVNGLHHVAICTSNIKTQIEFFTDVLGMELVALYWMHGVKGAWHGFVRMNDESCVAFVQMPAIKDIPIEIGKTHAGNPGAPCAAGALQHLALRVKNNPELLAMRDRIRSHGVPVLGPIDHGFCKSIYLAGPENLSIELSFSSEAINAEAWIDPEVVELAGITPAELARFKKPLADPDRGGQVPQPPLDSKGPHMVYPKNAYERIMTMPDDEVERTMSETEPPVRPP
jgi:catechol 2,3-dioxygenase-like lactoylglutathione lyase family enzyme